MPVAERHVQRRLPYAGGMSAYRALTARPFVLAQLIKGALEAEGFDVRLQRDGLGVVYGLDSGTFATRILVAEADLDRARSVLAEMEAEG